MVTLSSNSDINRLLQSGLDHYGKDNVDEAIDAWCEALRLDPGNADAVDYLESAGYVFDEQESRTLERLQSTTADDSGAMPDSAVGRAQPTLPEGASFDEAREAANDTADSPASSYVNAKGELTDLELKRLMVERRFEEALKYLYRLRSSSPRDTAISRSIQLLREKLTEVYSDQLVNLDRVPRLLESSERHSFSSEERHIALLVDGISSFGDILGISRLGRVPSLRILCEFQEIDLLTSASSSLSPPRRPAAPSLASLKNEALGAVVPTMGDFRAQAYEPSSPTLQSLRTPQVAKVAQEPSEELEDTPKSPKVRPPVDDSKEDGYEKCFAEAMRFYLKRDFEKAIALFEQCMKERPEDTRPGHNLKAILRRSGKS